MAETVLITGASRGIGCTTAQLFAENGYQVALNYNHSRDAALEMVKQLQDKGYSAQAFQADVSDNRQVQKMTKDIQSCFGSVDVLVNNAGISLQKLFTDTTQQDWDRIFDVNVKGIYHTCQAVLPDMIYKKQGRIINISSMWGVVGASCEVAYSAAKSAVIGLTKALAKELGPSNIQVNCVAPGVIETQMNTALSACDLSALCEDTPLGKIGCAQDVANMILFLASDKASFITGQVFGVNGGFVI